jgi:hypothetical protein
MRLSADRDCVQMGLCTDELHTDELHTDELHTDELRTDGIVYRRRLRRDELRTDELRTDVVCVQTGFKPVSTQSYNLFSNFSLKIPNRNLTIH